jgi:hemolysin III
METKSPSTAEALPFYTDKEDTVNSVLHGIGTVCAIAGLVLLNFRTRGFLGGEWKGNLSVVASLIFTVSMIAMFLASTLYHAVRHPEAKRILRIVDHSMIYIFIAGSYAPYCLTPLRGVWGWSLFVVEWTLALLGIILYNMGHKALRKKEVAVKIVMGWIVLVAVIPLSRVAPALSIILLIGGGLLYSLGTIVYHMKHIRMTHAIWHVFVLAGALCHWFSVWLLN